MHQINTITSTEIVDRFAPLEEGLVEVVVKKQLSILIVKLTTTPDENDKKAVGYVAPLPETDVVPQKRQGKFFEYL